MKNTIAALTASAALAVSLAACGSSGNTTTPPTGDAPAPAAAPASTTPPADGVAQFGGAVTFPGGVKVKVSQPTAIAAGQYAYGAVGGKIVVFDISVTNGSKTSLNASMFGFPNVTYGAAGTPASTATDMDHKVGSGDFTTILPGETQTVKVGYGIPASGFSAVRVEITGPSAYTDQPAVFKGAVH